MIRGKIKDRNKWLKDMKFKGFAGWCINTPAFVGYKQL